MAEGKTPDRDVYLKVGRPGDVCLLCSAPLNVDGHHPTVLQSDDAEEVIRKDFCLQCWSRMQEHGYFSFWVTKRVNLPSARERRLARSERNEALWRLFSSLYGNDSSGELAPQLFLLAHLLMKYRVLVYTGRTTGGLLTFAHPKLGESFEIVDVPLDSADFVSIKAALEQQALAHVPPADNPPPVDGEAGV